MRTAIRSFLKSNAEQCCTWLLKSKEGSFMRAKKLTSTPSAWFCSWWLWVKTRFLLFSSTRHCGRNLKSSGVTSLRSHLRNSKISSSKCLLISPIKGALCKTSEITNGVIRKFSQRKLSNKAFLKLLTDLILSIDCLYFVINLNNFDNNRILVFLTF